MTDSPKTDHPPEEEEILETAGAAIEPREETPAEEQNESQTAEKAEREQGGNPPEPEPAPNPADELRDQLLRLRADFENFRKRTRREKEEWTLRSVENICGDLLPVLDSFELGLKNAGSQDISNDVLKGFEMVQSQLRSVLGKYGLEAVNADEQKFDPNLHEAISHVPSPEVPPDHVLAMTRRGYTLGGRLLRPAQVVVSQGTGDAPEPEAEQTVPSGKPESGGEA